MDIKCDARGAVYPQCHPGWTAASLVATPFAPFATSAANTIAMELQYLKRALKRPLLQAPLILHCLSAGSGLAFFAVDEIRPHIPFMHAIWHVLSCAAVQQTLPLLKDSDDRGLWQASRPVTMNWGRKP